MADEGPPLRLLRPTDRAALRRLGAEAFAAFGAYHGPLDAWLRHPRVVTVVAPSRGGPRGFATVGPVEGEAYLLAICVAESGRRRGLGAALLAEALEQARRRRKHWGVDRMALEVAEANAAGRALFASAGFDDAGAGRPYADGAASRRMTRSLV